MTCLLTLNGLGVRLRDQTLLAPVHAQLSPGLTWVLGDEGTGKTILLRVLAGEMEPTCGELEGQLRGGPLRRGELGFSQVFWQDPRSSAHDASLVSDYLAWQQKRWATWDQHLASELLDDLDLSPHRGKRFDMLSAGTKRKFWLVSAFASGADLTLLDEPFAALDKSSVRVVHELLEAAAQHPTRAWVVADYEVPPGLKPGQIITLPG